MSEMEKMEGNDELIYASDEPDINALADAYNTTLGDLDTYFDTCLRSYNDRRNIWDGKTEDLRKSGATAFPWQGASDQEVNVIGERINTYVSISLTCTCRASTVSILENGFCSAGIASTCGWASN